MRFEFTDYSKVMKMKRENALLKRAVAIQNSRMQELAPLQARVRELERRMPRVRRPTEGCGAPKLFT